MRFTPPYEGLGWLALAAASSLTAGYAASSGMALPTVILAAVVGAAWAARRHLEYLIPAVLVVAALNGIPGVSVESLSVAGRFKAADVCAILLLLCGLYGLLRGRQTSAGLQRFLMMWAFVFVFYWCVTLVRTLDGGTPVVLAVSSGRDLLLFGVIAAVAGALFRSRDTARAFCAVIGGATALYAVLLASAAVNVVPPSIVNADHTRTMLSLTRVYTYMNQLIALVFMMALCYAVTHGGRAGKYALIVALTTGVASVVLMTRAIYLGIAAGMVAVAVLWLLKGDRDALRARRRAIMGAAAVTLALGTVVSAVPVVTKSEAVTTLTTRASGTVAELANPGSSRVNTVEYRRGLATDMLDYLGTAWPLGLGFQHPEHRYYVDLPAGALRNPDLGILSQVMTLGAIGTLLFVMPMLGLLIVSVRRARERGHEPEAWFWMGSTAWTVYFFVTILTLGLPKMGSVLVAGTMLGLACRFSPDHLRDMRLVREIGSLPRDRQLVSRRQRRSEANAR